MKKSNSILLVSSEFPPGPGGIGNHGYNLIREFVNNGLDVQVLTIKRSEFPNYHFDKLLNFPIYRYSNKIKFFSLLSFIYFFCKIIIRYNFKYVIVSGYNQLLLVGLMQKLFRFPSVAILHGHEPIMGSVLKKWLFKKIILKYNKKIAVSKFAKENVKKICKSDGIIIINNGFEKSKFDKYLNEIKSTNINIKKTIKLITVGTVSPRKGQQNIISKINYLKKYFPSIEYHIVGILQNKDEIKGLINKYKVKNKVFVHGKLSDLEMIKLLASSDIFILLSENQDNGEVEGFGIAILEANYLGLPAIGSIGCGIEDAIEENMNGKLIDPKSEKELLIALNDIIYNYKQFSKSSKDKVKNQTWDNVANLYIDFLEL